MKQTRTLTKEEVIEAVRESACFQAEEAYAARGGYRTLPDPRLYKELEDDHVRVVFPTDVTNLEEGSVIAITCLFDRKENVNIYGHTICAGPGVNALLRAIHAPLGKATPQPGAAGERAVLHFVAWKQAAWGKFLLDELELGNRKASEIWIRNFWKALDRMFGAGVLMNVPDDFHWKGD
ncbi:MAG TPA: hypothetical protein PKI11_12230 [Candidatus Hydrogenedentes bacterium]|nr:hypothetical protein [Candidatus Hydrogenedentota bacterium]HNT86499.1 hypothetical protein [Candidatus Hydrogenedentota bacterium]